MAREYLKVEGRESEFEADEMLTGTVRTSSANSIITDSAAGATAFASGVKTDNSFVGVDTSGNPVPTLLEAAQATDRRVGLVVTSRLTHATPAAFSAHVLHRDYEELIASQQLKHKCDVMFGGGRKQFQNTTEKEWEGIKRIESAEELSALSRLDLPVIGLFSDDHLPYEIDRSEDSASPSLTQMVAKSLELLDDRLDSKGFFLVIEASRIDHANHVNDAASSLQEVLEYNRVLGLVKDFAQSDGETMVVGVSDHETGGITLGTSVISASSKHVTTGGYEPLDLINDITTLEKSRNFPNLDENEKISGYRWFPKVLGAVSASSKAIAEELVQESGITESFKSFWADRVGFGISDMEADTLLRALSQLNGNTETLGQAVGAVISNRARIGWTTQGHTSVDVALLSFGNSRSRLRGSLDNTQIFETIARAWDLSSPLASLAHSLRTQYQDGELDVVDSAHLLSEPDWIPRTPLPGGNLRGEA